MHRLVPSLAFAALLATACGGSGGDPTTLPPAPPLGPVQDTQAPSIPLQSGTVQSSGDSSTNSFPGAGDNDLDQGLRGHFVFDLSSVPPGATIVSAIMRTRQSGSQGDTFPGFGVVDVDHVSAMSYADATLAMDVGTLAPDETLGPRTLDVTAQVATDVAAARATSQFRLRFSAIETDNDGSLDVVRFDIDSLIEIEYQ